MEFHEKLQLLRKKKNMTQEQLAQALYVSRAAVSKWESGRGYPGIDSLKAIAQYFSVSIDELLSCDEVLDLAQEDHRKKEESVRDRVFGALDCSGAMLFFLPLFRQATGEGVESVPLPALTEIAPYLKGLYWLILTGMVLWGILMLMQQNCRRASWLRNKYVISFGLHVVAVLLFIISMQPYGAAYLFLCLGIKALITAKMR